MGNLQSEWLVISSLVGAMVFVATNIAIFYWVLRYYPQALKSKDLDSGTTLNWSMITRITLHSVSFSGGMVLVLNVVGFLLTGVWNIDAKSLGLLALAFALMQLQSLDRFVTGLKKYNSSTSNSN